MTIGFKPCSVAGCNGNSMVIARGRGGMCQKHYRRVKKSGSVALVGHHGKCQRWLAEHVTFDGPECLIWPFARKSDGYGDVAFRGGHTTAHRAMCILAHGEPPTAGLDTAHSCGRGPQGCVHPKHLRWDTRSGNFADKLLHGTDNRGEKNSLAKLAKEDVLEIRRLRGKFSQSAIGKMFGITQSNVSYLQSGKSWSWLA